MLLFQICVCTSNFTESGKRTGGSESGGGVVRKKKALSVSADVSE